MKAKRKIDGGRFARLCTAWDATRRWLVARFTRHSHGHRKSLAQRRDCEHFGFNHDGVTWTASIGRYADGGVGEIFLTSTKPGSKVETMAQDAAVTASIAMQYGAPLDVIAGALSRDSQNRPQGALGVAMDAILDMERTP